MYAGDLWARLNAVSGPDARPRPFRVEVAKHPLGDKAVRPVCPDV